MVGYIIFFIFLFVFSVIDLFKESILKLEKYRSKFNVFFVVGIILFTGLRYKLANDWYNYFEVISQIETISEVLTGKGYRFFDISGYEYGFLLFVSIVKQIFITPDLTLQAVTLIISIFSYLSLFFFVFNNKSIPYKYLFVSIYVSLTMFREFDIYRQSISFYIFLFSVKYIGTNFIKYLSIVILAASFHISALLFLPLYFIYKFQFKRILILLLFVFYSFSLVFKFSLVSVFIDKISLVYPEFIVLQKLFLNMSSRDFETGFGITSLIYFLFLTLLFVFFKRLKDLPSSVNFLLNSFYIFIIINILFSDSKDLADRLSYYFYIGLAFIFVFSIQFIPKLFLIPYLTFILFFPFIRFSRVVADPLTKPVLVPYRNYFFVDQSDEDVIILNWKNKNEN
jgi:transmembrane protein EpsG